MRITVIATKRIAQDSPSLKITAGLKKWLKRFSQKSPQFSLHINAQKDGHRN